MLIKAFNRGFDRFLVWFNASVIGTILNAIGHFVKQLFADSAIVRAFSSENFERMYERSFIARFVNWFFGLFARANTHLSVMAQNSAILSFFRFIISKFNLTVFLVLLIAFGAVSYFTGIYLIAAAYVAVVFAFIVLCRPEVGIIAVAGLAPFIPTMAAAGLLGFTLVCFLLQALFGTRYKIKTNRTGLFLIFYIILLVVYGINSFTPQTSINIALLWSMFVISYFLVISLIDTKQKFHWAMFIFSTAALFTAFYGLFQYVSGQFDMTWVDKELFEELGLRVYSTFENPNVYGEYLLLAVPLTFAMTFQTKRVIGRLYYLLSTVVLLCALALTYSRGCYLALILAFAVFLFYVSRRLLAICAVLMLFVPFALPATIINRFASITNLADSSTSYRLHIWEGSLKMISDFWYMGIGHGTEAFNSVYPYYSLNSIVAPHSHNLYLQLTVEMGIWGLIVFLLVMFSFFNDSVSTIKKQTATGTRVMIAAGVAAVVGFLFQGLFDYVFYNYRVYLIFFMTLGLLTAYNSIIRREASQ